MGQFIFEQLNFARRSLLNTLNGISEEQADIVPEGFNNIRWNLGHVCLVQARMAFAFAEEPVEVPDVYSELFASGTKPSEWKIKPPTLNELIEILNDQPNRIQARLQDRLNEEVAKPFSRIPGLNLKTFDELLTFSLYHEGGHIQNVKTLIKMLPK